jgi:hypothetical protein
MPSVQALFSDSDLVNILSMEMKSKILPMMDNQAEEYFIYYKDIPYNNAVNTYALPSRSMANKLKAVCFVDSTGQEVTLNRLRPIETNAQLDVRGSTLSPFKVGYFLKNNNIVIYINSIQGVANFPTLRFKFCRMPNNLILTSNACQVSQINGNQITVGNLPSNYSTSVTYDMISNAPMFESWQDDAACTGINSLTMTFSSVPSTLSVGDWICLSGQSPIPQIPYSAFDLLSQLACSKCLEIHGDVQGFNVAMSQAKDMKDYFISIITPRVDDNPQKLSSTDSIWDSV